MPMNHPETPAPSPKPRAGAVSRKLLFLPGAAGDPAVWQPVGERLPAAWTKTYLDWPGLGNQPPSATVNGFDDLVARVEAQLGDEPVDLLAQSMGGVVALRVALNHPTKVRRLVLTATSGGIDMTQRGASDWRPEYRAHYPNAAGWITAPVPDLTDRLSEIAHPTLLLWGDADAISPVAVGQRLWQLLPRATLITVPGGNHDFVRERAADLVATITQHLE
jgi:pimeloyl-ACP methyl ester carboxylesterase